MIIALSVFSNALVFRFGFSVCFFASSGHAAVCRFIPKRVLGFPATFRF